MSCDVKTVGLCLSICLSSIQTIVLMCMNVYLHTCIRIYVCTCVCVCAFTCIYVFVWIRLCAGLFCSCIRLCEYVCMCVATRVSVIARVYVWACAYVPVRVCIICVRTPISTSRTYRYLSNGPPYGDLIFANSRPSARCVFCCQVTASKLHPPPSVGHV